MNVRGAQGGVHIQVCTGAALPPVRPRQSASPFILNSKPWKLGGLPGVMLFHSEGRTTWREGDVLPQCPLLEWANTAGLELPLGLHAGGGAPSAWGIWLCFPRCVSRDQGQKQSSGDLNRHSHSYFKRWFRLQFDL